jgi:uncharacterized protein Yka (UPF0111/DUF47 family)
MKHRWFLPEVPDVLGLLRQQAAETATGMEDFAAWSAGDVSRAQVVRDAEHQADGTRRQLQVALKSAFSTPMDAEDIYELSERLDAVLNGAKNAVREANVMGLAPNAALATMASELADGVAHVQTAFTALPRDGDLATGEADAAIKCERAVEHVYRDAMSKLLEVEDVRAVIAWREMYRRYARIGDALVRVAERVWYATVKEG